MRSLVKFLVLFSSISSVLVKSQTTLQRALEPDLVKPTPSIRYLYRQLNITRIVYPSEDTNGNRRPTHSRRPIEDSRLCKDNELLYPGDNEGDWVCDCKPGYLHYPLTRLCYEAYTLGPCRSGQILVLFNSSSSKVPDCVPNKCSDGKVFFNGGCYPINSEEGCQQFTAFIGRKVLLVTNPTTLSLTCADEDFRYACVENCCIGSKREYRNICRTKKSAETVEVNSK